MANLSGIYIIQNTLNDKVYVGSAKNVNARWRVHKHHLNKKVHHSVKLQRAWDKYGEGVFSFRLINYCNTETLIETEQFWIDFLRGYTNGYNSSPYAVTVIERNKAKKGVPLSEKHKQAIRDSKTNISEETRKKLSEANIGYKHSEETKKKMSQTRKGRIPWNKGKKGVKQNKNTD